MAERKGLEPSASGVTGRRYNRLNYRSVIGQKTLSISAFQVNSFFRDGQIFLESEIFFGRTEGELPRKGVENIQPLFRKEFFYGYWISEYHAQMQGGTCLMWKRPVGDSDGGFSG